MKAIATALLKAQTEMSNPKKDASNPFFKSKYADLNAVRDAVLPVLNKHGIIVLQPIVNIDGRNFVKTVLLHESGEQIESETEIIYSRLNDAQAQGSGITYARRYGLQSLVCIGADDDDGNGASVPPEPNKKGNQQTKPTPTDQPQIPGELVLKTVKLCSTKEELKNLCDTDYKVFVGNKVFNATVNERFKELENEPAKV